MSSFFFVSIFSNISWYFLFDNSILFFNWLFAFTNNSNILSFSFNSSINSFLDILFSFFSFVSCSIFDTSFSINSLLLSTNRWSSSGGSSSVFIPRSSTKTSLISSSWFSIFSSRFFLFSWGIFSSMLFSSCELCSFSSSFSELIFYLY